MDALDRSLDDIIKAKKPTGGSARGGKGGRGKGRGGKVTGPTGGRGARGTVLGVRGGGRGGRGGTSRAIAKPVRVIAVPARQQQQVRAERAPVGAGSWSHRDGVVRAPIEPPACALPWLHRPLQHTFDRDDHPPDPKRRVGTRCGAGVVL
jgi:hypothetical protein